MSHPGTLVPQSRRARRSLLAFPRRGLLAEAIAFQDPIDELCEQPAPVLLRATHYLVVALFIALLTVAAVTKVDIVVAAPGRLATATPPIVMQPMERGIIRDVRVRPGDTVTAGQILATLDPTFAEADTDALEKQARSLGAQLRRLDSEASGIRFDVGIAPGVEDMLQQALFRQRQMEYATRLSVFDEDIRRLRAGLQTAEDNRAALGRELEIARSVETMRATLLRLQSGSKLNLLEAQAGRMHTERDQQEAANRLHELLHAMESRQAERQAFVDGWRRELLENLVTVRAEASRVTAALAKAARLRDLVVVKAPADGVVLDVAQRTAGSVLREAEPLLTMVPRDATMVAEVMIASADVGDAVPGADVKIKVDAFPYQRHGMITGRLLSVSEESFSGSEAGGQGAVHRGRVEITGSELENVPHGAGLIPGMTLTAEIKAGTRTVLSYFLYPLTRGLRESIREP